MQQIKAIQPKQPFFLNATSHYCKHIVGSMGISHFYAFVVDDLNNLALGIPDDCVDIMYQCDEKNPEIILSGTGFIPRPLELISGKYYFGVRFLPGYIPRFHSVSFAEIVTRDIVFEELAREMETYQKIVHSRDFAEQIEIFMKMYCGKYFVEDTAEKYELKNYIRREIVESHGTKKIKQIVEESGYSDRYITKVFKENYGMPPKRFSEIIRFQNLLQALQRYEEDTINFMSVAVDYDYYDESHMLRFFRQYMNETPKYYYDFIRSEGYHNKLDVM